MDRLNKIPLREIGIAKYTRAFVQYNYLNNDQRQIYDYIVNHPDHMIIIESGPRTGRTSTLRTISYEMACTRRVPVYMLAYKEEFFHSFEYVAEPYTIAEFIMKLLSLEFCQYKQLESMFCDENMTSVQYLKCIISLLSKAKMPDMKGSLVILDEYHFIPKPTLLLILILLKHYEIGTIICGDKNILQSIQESSHAKCSSFDIAKRFANKVFHLSERFEQNKRYNDIIKYVAEFSCAEKLDDFGFALLAVLFPHQLLRESKYSDIHLATTNHELSQTVNEIRAKENIPCSIYSTNYLKLWESGIPMKFLPFLPLCCESKYYVDKHSEFSQATLVSFNESEVKLRTDSGEEIRRKTNDLKVMFEKHRDELLACSNGAETVANYPIYPVNIMSFHKYQGCRFIQGNLDLNMSHFYCKYQSLYLALSRVRDPKEIVRIRIPRLLSHLVSSIINVEEHSTGTEITAEILRQRMQNYKFYDVEGRSQYEAVVMQFLMNNNNINERQRLRRQLIEMIGWMYPTILQQPESNSKNKSRTTTDIFIDNLDLFITLSHIDEIDRDIWLHEFILCSPDMSLVRDDKNKGCYLSYPCSNNFDMSYGSDKSSVKYIIDMAERENQEAGMFKLENTGLPVIKNLFVNKFKYDVYMKYVNAEKITVDWLIEQLNEMTSVINVDMISKPRAIADQ